jgi:cation-transporting ATPase I
LSPLLPVLDPLAALRGMLGWLDSADGRRHRRAVMSSDGRAHIEVRGAQRPERAALVADVKAALERLRGVNWAEVNAIIGRAVVVFDPEALSVSDLISTIETVEELHEANDERFPHNRPDHPADREPIQRNLFAIAADVAGLGVATVAQTLHLPRMPFEIPGLVSVVESQRRVRGFLENRLGRSATDVMLATANALTQALGQGPLGLIVDVAHRGGVLQELQARRVVWAQREPELVVDSASVRHPALVVPPRPVSLPSGPIERYSDRAAIASLGAMGIVLGVTRNPRRASDLLLAGIPKAATLGRDSFAAQLDRALAGHGVIAMDPAALRRLDRVDMLVLEASVAMSDAWSIDDVVTFAPGLDPLQCTLRARDLFDAQDPRAMRTRGAWVLTPLGDTYPLPPDAKTRGRLLAGDGRNVLGLWRGEELHALVAVLEEPAPIACELVQSAQRVGLGVLLVGGSNAFGRRLGIDERIVASRLVQELHELQRSGHVVMLVGAHHPAAMRAADVSLGIEVPGEQVPWAAHLVIGPGLVNAWRVVDSIRTAKDVSRRSALLALGGASTGGVWALVGPASSAAQRALLPINASAMLSIGTGAIAGVQSGRRSPPRPRPRHRWHELDAREALDQLASSAEGLDPDEQRRRRASSTARVVRVPVSLARAAIDELANPLTPLLALGSALSAAVGSITDAALVGGVVGVNALVGAVQRVQTERSLLRLEEVGDTPVRVRVAGELCELRADALVVGDVIELEAGEPVPADCRLLEAVSLEVDESAITGESLPVTKSVHATPGAPVPERTSMLYEGSAIAAGRAVALVVEAGADTEAGRSAAATSEPPPSGMEQRLSRLIQLTVPVTLAGGAAVTGLGFLYRRPAREAVGAGVSLMVAAVPEGLPTLATLAQVAAARRLASRNALVRNPRAIEALGRVDQVCFDKTGTLTEGSISLVCVSDGTNEEPLDALSDQGRAVLAAALRATPAVGSNDVLPHATDQAIVAGAANLGVADAHGFGTWDRLEEFPFESRRGYHAVLGHGGAAGAFVSVKGAPEAVVPLATTWRCGDNVIPLDAAARRALEDKVQLLGRRGLRVLAVAEAATGVGAGLGDGAGIEGLQLLGFVALADLVRPTAAGAVRDLHSAGVHVTMVTGDHSSTAEAIAAELGLLDGGRVLTGTDLEHLSDDEFDAVIAEVAIFARVTPVQKVRIVAAYQRVGRCIAMTGDGANDAAAIRLADVGLALGSRGTAAARDTADVVVIDDRIETVIDAIIEGRAMWASVRDAVAILVGGNLGEIGFTVLGTAVTGTAPLNPRQLLLVNLLTDMAPALAIALREPLDRSPETLLQEGPDASLAGALTSQIALRAGATAAGATAAWSIARLTGTPTRARTIALAALVGTQLGQTLVMGGRSPLVLGATALSVGALVATIQTPGVSQFFGCRPIGPVGWLTAIGASTAATGASVVVPWAFEAGNRIAARHSRDHVPLPALPSGATPIPAGYT